MACAKMKRGKIPIKTFSFLLLWESVCPSKRIVLNWGLRIVQRVYFRLCNENVSSTHYWQNIIVDGEVIVFKEFCSLTAFQNLIFYFENEKRQGSVWENEIYRGLHNSTAVVERIQT